MDGLDLALVSIDPQRSGPEGISISKGRTLPLPADLKTELALLATPGHDEIERMGRADRRLGEFIGHAIIEYLGTLNLAPGNIRAIGSHGQTIRHRPDIDTPFTLQIGDPNCIAEITGIDTVADFRRRDMAAGGQGAPLVPLFHETLFGAFLQASEASDEIAVLNIGGISNLSLLSTTRPTLGWDTGPGNGLLDAWISQHQNQPYDKDGHWASQGQADGALLESLLADPYFQLPPPKSTGREYFSMNWLAGHLPAERVDPVQVQATLTELTARSIAAALTDHAHSPSHLLVCGGGRRNTHLMSRLAALCDAQVSSTDAHGIEGDSLEAAAFAWLAARTIAGLPGNAPAVTGAEGDRVLGTIYPG